MTLPSAIIVSCQADNPLRSFFIHFSPIFFMIYRYYLRKWGKDTFFKKLLNINKKLTSPSVSFLRFLHFQFVSHSLLFFIHTDSSDLFDELVMNLIHVFLALKRVFFSQVGYTPLMTYGYEYYLMNRMILFPKEKDQ